MSTQVHAQLNLSISPSPVGSGARAAGMADAFIAVADDATAASWNPAGLVQLERPEIAIVGSFNALIEDFNTDQHPEFETTQRSNQDSVNFLSLTLPIKSQWLGRRSTFSLSYQNKYDFTRAFDIQLNETLALSPTSNFQRELHQTGEQSGSIGVISPALAVEITDWLFVGLTANFWRNSFVSDNRWTTKTAASTVTTLGSDAPFLNTFSETTSYKDFSGENFSIGFLIRIKQRWRLGLRYDSQFSGEANFSRITARDGATVSSVTEDRRIHFPATAAMGISYRRNDRLTLAFDLSTTKWNDSYIQTESGRRFSMFDGVTMDDPDLYTPVDRTFTARLGMEYIFIPKIRDTEMNSIWSLRTGLFFDQEPAVGRKSVFEKGDGKPDTFYGFTAGVGFLASNQFNFDFAYQLRYGDHVNSDIFTGELGFSEDVMQHRFLLSSVIYF